MTFNIIDKVAKLVIREPWAPDAIDEEIMKILYSHTGDFISYGSIAVPLKENGILSDWEEGYLKYHSHELSKRLDRLWWHHYVDESLKHEYRLAERGIGHIRKMEREGASV